MTKKDLLKALAPFTDETDIYLGDTEFDESAFNLFYIPSTQKKSVITIMITGYGCAVEGSVLLN